MLNIEQIATSAKNVATHIALASTDKKNSVLELIAQKLITHQDEILKANDEDVKIAKENGMSGAMLDRLILKNRIELIAEDVRNLITLPDPVGKVIDSKTLPNGLQISKQRTPIGVIGVIYESRPNVTVDVSALVIKTGNCAILRGGSETIKSNRVLLKVITESLSESGLPKEAIQLIDSPDRKYVLEMLHQYDSIDMIIPRGGESLHRFCRQNSQIPVITGGMGICHLYVDQTADLTKSIEVIKNAKMQRPTVCNALDTLLVHKQVAELIIPKVINALDGVEFHLDDSAWQYQQGASCKKAEQNDWDTEWLSLTLGIKVVNDLSEAIDHIKAHSTGHSDGILTHDQSFADSFTSSIDSASVYVNASTRFTDGSQFGLGAEVAISTQKLHARGPMGLEELTTYKWVVKGDYHVRP